MKALQSDKDYPLINPRTGEEVKSINANELFDKIAYNVWQTGDPGCLFLDTINRFNPVKDEIIETTNPCGESPLPTRILDYNGEVAGSCNLGSINLNRIVKDNEVDWEHFSHLIRNGVRFLDSVIERNKFPLDFIEMTTKRSRRVGLGFMGLADLFVRLDIPYNSQEAFELAEKLSKFMYDEARDESHQLALEYGDFPAIDNSIFKGTNMRNATVLSIAPTGSIGMMANASNGCEPLFYAGYKKTTYLGDEIIITEGVIDYLKRHNLYSQENLNNISNYADDIIVTAHHIHWADHIKMQGIIQKFVDLSVSKTINMPSEATSNEIKSAYIQAWKMGCRGITVFRNSSKAGVIQKCDGESCTL
jgi:ribonucleoside-diphosphate reductase alpha chain